MAISQTGDTTVDLVVVPSAAWRRPAEPTENIALPNSAPRRCRTPALRSCPPGCGASADLALLLNRADALNVELGRFAQARPGRHLCPRRRPGDRDEGAGELARGNGDDGGGQAGACLRRHQRWGNDRVDLDDHVYVGDYGAAQDFGAARTLMWWGNDGDRQRSLVFGSGGRSTINTSMRRGRFGPVAVDDCHRRQAVRRLKPRRGRRRLTDRCRQLRRPDADAGLRPLSGWRPSTTRASERHPPVVGTERWLSARKVKVNLLTENTDYDLVTRRMTGRRHTRRRGDRARLGGTRASATGNGLSRRWGSQRLQCGADVVRMRRPRAPIPKARLAHHLADTRSTAAAYGTKVKAGWMGHVDTVTYGDKAAGWAPMSRRRGPPSSRSGRRLTRPSAMRASAPSPRQRGCRGAGVLRGRPAATYAGARWSPMPGRTATTTRGLPAWRSKTTEGEMAARSESSLRNRRPGAEHRLHLGRLFPTAWPWPGATRSRHQCRHGDPFPGNDIASSTGLSS